MSLGLCLLLRQVWLSGRSGPHCVGRQVGAGSVHSLEQAGHQNLASPLDLTASQSGLWDSLKVRAAIL